MDIDGDRTFYTVTMANVYANQGRYEEAARIYRYLLDQTPDRHDLKKALEEVSANLPDVPGEWRDISSLVEQWVAMLLASNAMEQLQQAKRCVGRWEE